MLSTDPKAEDAMPEIPHDQDGFTCVCGARNEYPEYVKEHWSVRLRFSCTCRRDYILFHGTVVRSVPETPDVSDSEAFGD
jgi:hypothetical protein